MVAILDFYGSGYLVRCLGPVFTGANKTALTSNLILSKNQEIKNSNTVVALVQAANVG